MRKFLAVAMGSMLAFVGFAGAANAGATVELIWASTGTDTIEDVAIGSEITADIVLTAGPEGVSSVGLSVDYSAAGSAGSVEFARSACLGGIPGSICFSDGIDTGSQLVGMSAGAFGAGLTDGNTVSVGTVTFLKIANPDGTFSFPVGVLVTGDDIFDSDGLNINDVSEFFPAQLINVPEPGAISMLAMGLGGMLLAGRGRRS
jgi:hypothetical protein